MRHSALRPASRRSHDRRGMRRWGKRVCRTRSGSPWRALGLVRSKARSRASLARCSAIPRRRTVLSALLPYHGARADDAGTTQARSSIEAFCLGIRPARPSRDRGAGAHARHSLLRRGHRDPAGAHAQPPRRDSRRRRATRASHPRPRSTAPMRCCSPSRRSSWPGRRRGRAGNHRRSDAGDGRRRASPRARLRHLARARRRAARWSARSMRCARAA